MNDLYKKLWFALGIGTLVFVIGNGLEGGFHFNTAKELLVNFGFYQLYTVSLFVSNAFYFKYVNKFKWQNKHHLLRAITNIIGGVVITIAVIFIIRMMTALYYEGIAFDEFLKYERWRNYVFGVAVTLFVVIILHAVYYFKQTQEQKVKESQIVAKTEVAKFESLKSQLDPHFLFNSLNVLTSLINENPDKAEDFTTKLSKIYRYVLEQKDKDLISVEEELAFAKTYMTLLQTRFEEAIVFSLPEAVDEELKIVPLTLQLLLENAVKHNVISSDNPLEIKIYIDGKYLCIENNVNKKQVLEKSTKVGLKNIIQRYDLVTDDKVIIDSGRLQFKVKVPLLTQKIKKMQTDFISENQKYIRAKKRVDKIKDFYTSLLTFCFVIPFLIYINLTYSGWFHWFWFPVFGMVMSAGYQAYDIYFKNEDWEQKKIKEFMKNDQGYYGDEE